MVSFDISMHVFVLHHYFVSYLL